MTIILANAVAVKARLETTPATNSLDNQFLETRSSSDCSEEAQLSHVRCQGCLRSYEELGPGDNLHLSSSSLSTFLIVMLLFLVVIVKFKGHPC